MKALNLLPQLRRRIAFVWVFAWLGAMPLALLLISGSMCPIAGALGIPCPGCGGSRAAASAASGNLSESFSIHPLALPSMAVFGAIALAFRHKTSGGQKLALVLAIALSLSLFALWIYRMANGTLPSVQSFW